MWYCNGCGNGCEEPIRKGKTVICPDPDCESDDIFEICDDCMNLDNEVTTHCEDCGKPLCDDCKGREFGYGVYYCEECRPVEDDGQRCPHDVCGWEDN